MMMMMMIRCAIKKLGRRRPSPSAVVVVSTKKKRLASNARNAPLFSLGVLRLFVSTLRDKRNDFALSFSQIRSPKGRLGM